MLCKKPFHMKGAAFGCGQCMPCRINRRRIWSHRILLEALVSPSASFLTLTYGPEFIPDGGSLVPRDLTLFLKRLRKHRRLRYFAVGEYGDFSERPHYHAALFGVGPEDVDVVRQCWGLGFVMLGELTLQSASYIAGYVTKKLTSKTDVRLNGRYPEFARMSLRPGIGALAMSDVASEILSERGQNEVARIGDVPAVLRHGSRLHPLGRYLRRRLREQSGVEANDTGADIFKKSAELQAMYENYKKSSPSKAFAVYQKEKEDQKVLNQEARFKIFNQRGKL